MNTLLKPLVLCTLSSLTLLTACGGGGGTAGENTAVNPAPSAVDYEPKEELLEQAAQSSDQLYVKPNFGFNNYKQVAVQLDLSQLNSDRTLVRFYKVPATTQSLEDVSALASADKSLLYRGFSDSNGYLNTNLELPNHVKKVLISMQVIGSDNQTLLAVQDNETQDHRYSLVHTF